MKNINGCMNSWRSSCEEDEVTRASIYVLYYFFKTQIMGKIAYPGGSKIATPTIEVSYIFILTMD